jgi:hypothetical protein
MANSTTNLDTIATAQSQKEVTANALFNAASPATAFGVRPDTTSGLTFGYYGGTIVNSSGAYTQIANGTVALTASTTNYVEVSIDGVVSKNTSGFTAGSTRLYTVVTGASSITSYTDWRTAQIGGAGAGATILNLSPSSITPPATGGALPRGLAASIGRRRVWWAQADMANGSMHVHAITASATGTASNPGIASHTSAYNAGARFRLTSSAAINNRGGIIFQNNQILRGNVAGAGGFILEGIFGWNAANADSVFAVGVYGTNALPGNTDPSALTNFAGFALDSADAQFQFMHNDASGTCTKVSLGADFPRPTVNVSHYFWQIYCDANGSSLGYYLLNLADTTKVASSSVNTNLPVNTTALYTVIALGTGPTTATAAALDIYRVHCETTL